MGYPKELNVKQIFIICAYFLASFWKRNINISHCAVSLPMFFVCLMYCDFVFCISKVYSQVCKVFSLLHILGRCSFYQYEALLFISFIIFHSSCHLVPLSLYMPLFLVSICLVHIFQLFISNFSSYFVFSVFLTRSMRLECVIDVFLLSESLCLLIDEFNSFDLL